MVARRTRADTTKLHRAQRRLAQAAALLDEVQCSEVQCLRVCQCGLADLVSRVKKLSLSSVLMARQTPQEEEQNDKE